MEDEKKSTNDDKVTHAQPVPRQNSIRLDLESSLGASFVSQQSGSVGTSASSSPSNTCDGNSHQPGPSESTTNNSAGSAQPGEHSFKNGNPRDSVSATFQHWLTDAVTPSSVHSAGRQDAAADDLSVVSEEVSTISDDEYSRELFMPGELHTPILGYETMEARSKFTVYKIHVEKRNSDVPPTSWFVFRRYSDFVHLNDKLKLVFPAFQLALPPKRWFRDNFEKDFLDSRRLGLQLFLDNVINHRDICNSEPVRDFFCTDDPPGPHDSLEESRALCDLLEETLYGLRQDLQEKDSEVEILKDELALYKSQVKLLTKQLRTMNKKKKNGDVMMTNSASCSVDDLEQASSQPVQDSGIDGESNTTVNE